MTRSLMASSTAGIYEILFEGTEADCKGIGKNCSLNIHAGHFKEKEREPLFSSPLLLV